MIKKILNTFLVMALSFAFTTTLTTAYADNSNAEAAPSSSSDAVSSETKVAENNSTAEQSSSESDDVDKEELNRLLSQYLKQETNSSENPAAEGNASIVQEKKIIHDSAEMQFIAVTTKDGHVFYILIDYTAISNGDVENSVYFLNHVVNRYGHEILLE